MSVTVNNSNNHSTSFCIDALLAREDPVRSPLSSSSDELGSSVSPQPVSSSSSPSFPTSSPHFFPPPSSLYAAMYSGHHPVHSQSMVSSSGSLMHSSAFHPPIQDIKNPPSTPHLSMDWLTRAGLLFHRTSGTIFSSSFLSFLLSVFRSIISFTLIESSTTVQVCSTIRLVTN